MSRDDFKYLSQQFNNKGLDLVKQKGFYPHEHMSNFKKFYSSMTDKKSDKEYKNVLEVRDTFQMKMMEDCNELYLKCDNLLLAYVLKNFTNNSFKNYGLCPCHF